MRRSRISVFVLTGLVSCACTDGIEAQRKIEPVAFSDVKIEDSFWSPRLESHKSVTIPVCIDQIENRTGRLTNFDRAAAGQGAHQGYFYDDSDVYKALEGFASSLVNNPDSELEAKCDDWISRIAAAQREDGYLDTWFQLARPGEEWTDMDKHELYCTGHLIEAAIAYYEATGKTSLLDVARRMVDNAMSVVGPGRKHWVPGHEEIELALVKLYTLTGEKRYLEFAHWLLEERGHGHGFYSGETNPSDFILSYYQDKVPVSELTDICGHAVRAMYLYCGMADVAALDAESRYKAVLDTLWADVVERNMYITGGIGQSARNEGITEDYDLPNAEAYCETCASIGMILWNARMNWMSGDAKYADVLERSLYNAALAGISLSGDRFFYVNPLESFGDRKRAEWFGTACCPSNMCRFLPSLGGYVYGTSSDAVYVNLFIGSKASFKMPSGRVFSISQECNYPWDGNVKFTVGSSNRADLMLRVPSWCDGVSFSVNGRSVKPEISEGYARICGPWKDGDIVEMNMAMDAELVAADPRVKADIGKRAVQRGPLVYCAEETDNPDFSAVSFSAGTSFSEQWESSLLGGVVSLTSDEGVKFVPYYSWCNREQGRMKVWIDLK